MEPSPQRRPGTGPLPRGRRWVWLGLVGVVLALAWFDGGEEPIHPIVQDIAVPEAR